MNKSELVSILASALLGLVYVIFFVGRDPVLLVIFGLQTFRGGLALRSSVKKRDRN